MRLSVRHRTTYKYASRARYLAQMLRMTPLDGPGQKVLRWSVEADRGRRLARTTATATATSRICTRCTTGTTR